MLRTLLTLSFLTSSLFATPVWKIQTLDNDTTFPKGGDEAFFATSDQIVYQAIPNDKPKRQDVFLIKRDGTGKTCLTCELPEGKYGVLTEDPRPLISQSLLLVGTLMPEGKGNFYLVDFSNPTVAIPVMQGEEAPMDCRVVGSKTVVVCLVQRNEDVILYQQLQVGSAPQLLAEIYADEIQYSLNMTPSGKVAYTRLVPDPNGYIYTKSGRNVIGLESTAFVNGAPVKTIIAKDTGTAPMQMKGVADEFAMASFRGKKYELAVFSLADGSRTDVADCSVADAFSVENSAAYFTCDGKFEAYSPLGFSNGSKQVTIGTNLVGDVHHLHIFNTPYVLGYDAADHFLRVFNSLTGELHKIDSIPVTPSKLYAMRSNHARTAFVLGTQEVKDTHYYLVDIVASTVHELPISTWDPNAFDVYFKFSHDDSSLFFATDSYCCPGSIFARVSLVDYRVDLAHITDFGRIAGVNAIDASSAYLGATVKGGPSGIFKFQFPGPVVQKIIDVPFAINRDIQVMDAKTEAFVLPDLFNGLPATMNFTFVQTGEAPQTVKSVVGWDVNAHLGFLEVDLESSTNLILAEAGGHLLRVDWN